MDFLFHSLSDKEKEEIRKEAKKLLDSFSEELSKIRVPEGEPSLEREKSEREEGEGEDPEEGFRERMLDNAPNKSSDFVIAEKKKWE